MSPGAIAVTAILVSGFQVTCLVGAGAWLIYTKLFAATPKPQPQQPAAQPVDLTARRTGT